MNLTWPWQKVKVIGQGQIFLKLKKMLYLECSLTHRLHIWYQCNALQESFIVISLNQYCSFNSLNDLVDADLVQRSRSHVKVKCLKKRSENGMFPIYFKPISCCSLDNKKYDYRLAYFCLCVCEWKMKMVRVQRGDFYLHTDWNIETRY